MTLSLTCPICKAGNTRGPQCRRCKADLSLLFALEQERQGALASAYHHAAQGRWDKALDIAQGVEALRAGDDVRRFLAVAHLVQGNFAQAWQWYQGVSARAAPAAQ